MTDAELQANEIKALTSIFDKAFVEVGKAKHGEVSGHILVHVQFPESVTVYECRNTEQKVISLDHLPPLQVQFRLPVDYPSANPPYYTLTCTWLNKTQVSRLCQKLDIIWHKNQGSEILFLWVNFLEEETFYFLDLELPLDFSKTFGTKEHIVVDHNAAPVVHSVNTLIKALVQYDKEESEHKLMTSSHLCDICLNKNLGFACIRLVGCGHIFCKDCVKDYIAVQITNGNVSCLTCPDVNCEKLVHPSEVQELVSESLFAKYDRMLLQLGLDKMVDVAFCPRPFCQSPVIRDADSMICLCPNCSHTFCFQCKHAYHGVSPCLFTSDKNKRLRDEYMQADRVTKHMLVQQYGHRAISLAIEEGQTNEWLEKFTKKCPSCGTHIQKSDGCNRITCQKCHANFCWLCGAVLSRYNPYLHYNDAQNDCFQKLFEGTEIVEEYEEDFVEFV